MSRVLTYPASAPSAIAAAPGPRVQPRVVTFALGLLGLGAAYLAAAYSPTHAGLFLVGGGLGLVLYQAAFGFTAAFRAFVTSGDGRGIRAHMLMFAVATLLFAPVLAAGEVWGRTVSGGFAPASVSVLVGAFIFAIGMQLGGGCGSGTLFHLGGGTTSMVIVLVAFIAGGVIATFHMDFWWEVPSLGVLSLGHTLGWPQAVALQLGACALIAALAWWIERRRFGGPRRLAPPSTHGWRRLLHGPWPLFAGGIALAVLNLLTLVFAGHPWTITWAFTLWGGKVLQAVGYDLSAVPFWRGEFQQAALAAPLLADVTSVMDFGLVLGAFLAAGIAGRFAPKRRIPVRRLAAAVLGGLLLGYGARIAFGCNIGAYFAGVASTSLHGWLWGAAALLGTPIGVRLRRAFGMEP